MAYLFVLSEGQNDDKFYEACAEKITGKSFEKLTFQLRNFSGRGRVTQNLQYVLAQMKYSGRIEDGYFIVALDNDRAPNHFNNHHQVKNLLKKDQIKECAVCFLENAVEEGFGAEQPVKVAIAVPVEMIESWLLRMSNPDIDELPMFSEATKAGAKAHYGKIVPPQLKDLCRMEQEKLGVSAEEYLLKCAFELLDEGKIEELAESVPDFAYFKDQLEKW